MPSKTKKIAVVSLIVVIIITLLLPKLKDIWAGSETPTGGGQEQQAVTVEGYKVVPQPLAHKIKATGTVLPNEAVQLTAEIAGKVTGIHFKEGGFVNSGQLLVKINDDELQAELRKVQEELSMAQKTFERKKKLLAKEAISHEAFDQAQNEFERLKAQEDQLQARIAKTEIRAPFSGVIGLRHISEGAYISPSVPIASLQDIEPVKLDFAIPEKYIRSVSEGDKVRFTTSAFDTPFVGEIYAIEPRINTETRMLQLRAIVPNKTHAVLPGAFADIELELEEIPDALMIPAEAVMAELNKKKVFLAERGKAVPREVETGIRTERMVQVNKGLQSGDVVIVSGILNLRPGTAVEMNRLDSLQTSPLTE